MAKGARNERPLPLPGPLRRKVQAVGRRGVASGGGSSPLSLGRGVGGEGRVLPSVWTVERFVDAQSDTRPATAAAAAPSPTGRRQAGAAVVRVLSLPFPRGRGDGERVGCCLSFGQVSASSVRSSTPGPLPPLPRHLLPRGEGKQTMSRCWFPQEEEKQTSPLSLPSPPGRGVGGAGRVLHPCMGLPPRIHPRTRRPARVVAPPAATLCGALSQRCTPMILPGASLS